MSKLDDQLFEDIYAVISKLDFKDASPNIVHVLGKMAAVMIGQITGYTNSSEDVTKEAVRLFAKGVEETALAAHRHILLRQQGLTTTPN